MRIRTVAVVVALSMALGAAQIAPAAMAAIHAPDSGPHTGDRDIQQSVPICGRTPPPRACG